MARILGPLPADASERKLLRQLQKQLPQPWVVLSNVTWATKDESGIVSDGQSDFVVLVPGSGMVIVEVKGSREIWIDQDGMWYRRGHDGEAILVSPSPPEQAMKNMYKLARIVEQKGLWPKFPGRYSWVVAYPNGIASNMPSMFDSSTMVTSLNLHQLEARIRHALTQRGSDGKSESFTIGVAEKVAAILTSQPFAVTKADTAANVQDDLELIETLTRQQFSALRGIFEFPHVAVTGPAGSGKTLLAIWRLQALVEAGKKALYVCFNKKLAESLRNRNPDLASNITSVDKFFMEFCQHPAISGEPSHFFKEALPEQAFGQAAMCDDDDKYDAIIVDEGQDFGDLRLYALLELLRPGDSGWVIFTDRRQDLFKVGGGDAFGADVIFKLYHNCRNTVRVNSATNAFIGLDEIASMPGMPAGEVPEITACADNRSMASKAWELAHRWSTDRGVVILSPYSLKNSCMADYPKGHGMSLTEDLSSMGLPGQVCFSTIRSFKGIEAPAVILVDAGIPVNGPGSTFYMEDLYVACTRPTARLAILSKTNEASEWFKDRIVRNGKAC
ncbi:nuclease-related domain-containing DEAD/DEAH box helicase [Massilia litorea]|uniref:NERD domain-containing protein n=1 Tax=Massilia litorea TaxID=2769491 RepID=A0A7L9U709_9BURK|nr:NERD domain-containing protein/DEAD/DEAH box helicase [Massilia litorea]QOL50239.1 NERD domain-containing protein [Massilia litorea]